MHFIKTKNTLLATTFAATIFVVAFGVAMPAAAQSNNDLLPPPLVDGQSAKKVKNTSPAAHPTVEYLSDDTLQKAFEQALTSFGQDTTAPATPTPIAAPVQQGNQMPGQVPTVGGAASAPITRMPQPNNLPATAGIAIAASSVSANPIPIGQVRLNVALENMPLEQVMENVMGKVSERTGKWDIRWRLNNENQRIRNERININAETDFEDFMAYLMERVNNMTGIQLFVKVFEGSRLIIIADNY